MKSLLLVAIAIVAAAGCGDSRTRTWSGLTKQEIFAKNQVNRAKAEGKNATKEDLVGQWCPIVEDKNDFSQIVLKNDGSISMLKVGNDDVVAESVSGTFEVPEAGKIAVTVNGETIEGTAVVTPANEKNPKTFLTSSDGKTKILVACENEQENN